MQLSVEAYATIEVRLTVLQEFEVTLRDLKHPEEHYGFAPLFKFIKDHWIEPNPEYERSMGIGRVRIWVDEDRHMRFEFISRLTLDPLENKPEPFKTGHVVVLKTPIK